MTANVGAFTLPLVPGTVGGILKDDIVDVLLALLAHGLNYELNGKLSRWAGTSVVAVPTGAAYAFDPMHPRGHCVKRPAPALYLWWDGTVRCYQHTQLQWAQERVLSALYLIDELPSIVELERRVGLFGAIGAVFSQLISRRTHPTFTYNGSPVGTVVEDCLPSGKKIHVKYLGGQGITRIGIDDPTTTPQLGRASGRDYPGFTARIQIDEIIDPREQPDTTNVTRDSEFAITHDSQPVLDRILGGTDGTDTGDFDAS